MRRAVRYLPFVLALLATSIAAQPKSAAADIERQLTAHLCEFEKATSADLVNVSSFRFVRQDAFPCVQRLLGSFQTLTLSDSVKRKISVNTLWNLAETVAWEESITPAERDAGRRLLERIRDDHTHPLRGHAWLAVAAIDNNTFATPATLAEAEKQLDTVLPKDLTDDALKEMFVTGHPLLRSQLLKLFIAHHLKEFDSRPSTESQAWDGLFGIASWPTHPWMKWVLEPLITAVMQTRHLVDRVASQPMSASMPGQMLFTVTERACAGRGGCQAANDRKFLSISGDQVGREWWDKGLGGDHSQAFIMLHFLGTHAFVPYLTYQGSITSYVRGGYRNGGLGVSAEDQKSSVALAVDGEATIPQCPMGATGCFGVYSVIAGKSDEDVSIDILQSGQTSGLSSGDRLTLNVTSAPATIKVRIRHDKEHVGAWGAPEPHHDTFYISFAGPLVLPSGEHLEDWLKRWRTPPPWGVTPTSRLSAEDIQRGKDFARRQTFGDYASLLRLFYSPPSDSRLPNPFPAPPRPGYVPFGELLSRYEFEGAVYGDRYFGIYLRLLLADYILRTPELALTATERQRVISARTALSAESRRFYSANVSDSIAAKKKLLALLNPTLVDKALTSLTKGTPLTRDMSDHVAKLVAALAATGDGSAPVGLVEGMDRARRADNVLEAVLSLSEFRREYMMLVSNTRAEINALQVEAAQLAQVP